MGGGSEMGTDVQRKNKKRSSILVLDEVMAFGRILGEE